MYRFYTFIFVVLTMFPFHLRRFVNIADDFEWTVLFLEGNINDTEGKILKSQIKFKFWSSPKLSFCFQPTQNIEIYSFY